MVGRVTICWILDRNGSCRLAKGTSRCASSRAARLVLGRFGVFARGPHGLRRLVPHREQPRRPPHELPPPEPALGHRSPSRFTLGCPPTGSPIALMRMVPPCPWPTASPGPPIASPLHVVTGRTHAVHASGSVARSAGHTDCSASWATPSPVKIPEFGVAVPGAGCWLRAAGVRWPFTAGTSKPVIALVAGSAARIGPRLAARSSRPADLARLGPAL